MSLIELNSVDAAFVFQALYHAFDWRAALAAAFRTLKPGGWMIIADAPNVLHTYINYRMAKMSGTREIGPRRRDMVPSLREIGFREIRVLNPRFDDRWRAHWLAARR